MLDRRGQVRSIEAILAAAVIFTALSASYQLKPLTAPFDERPLEDAGANILIQLEANGTLSRLVDQRNWTAIRNIIELIIPLGLSYNLTVYDAQLRALNNVTISNGGLVGFDIVSVQLPIASPGLNYSGYVARLQLSRYR